MRVLFNGVCCSMYDLPMALKSIIFHVDIAIFKREPWVYWFFTHNTMIAWIPCIFCKSRLMYKALFFKRKASRLFWCPLRSPGWWYSVLKLALVVLAYFSSSVALTFYQKDLISALPFPLVIVTCHLVIKFILAGICRSAISYCCPSVSPVPTGQSAASQR